MIPARDPLRLLGSASMVILAALVSWIGHKPRAVKSHLLTSDSNLADGY